MLENTTGPAAAEVFTFLRRWADAAKQCASHDAPDLDGLCRIVQGGVFLDAGLSATPDAQGRPLIQVTVEGPKGSGEKSRFMLPVHAATTRALELAKAGVRLHVGARGQQRFSFDLVLGSHRTNLSRILFGLPANRDLVERNEHPDQHREVTPSSFRVRRGLDRTTILALVRERGNGELADLLADLFVLADRWHDGELEESATS